MNAEDQAGARDDVTFPGFGFGSLEVLRRVFGNCPSWDVPGTTPREDAQCPTDSLDDGMQSMLYLNMEQGNHTHPPIRK